MYTALGLLVEQGDEIKSIFIPMRTCSLRKHLYPYRLVSDNNNIALCSIMRRAQSDGA